MLVVIREIHYIPGRYAVNVGHPFAHVPGSPGGVDPKYRLLTQDLEEVGYRNHIVGKWHLGASKPSFHPLRRGFHSFYGILGGGINFHAKQVLLRFTNRMYHIHI